MPLITIKPPRRPSTNAQFSSESASPPTINTTDPGRAHSPEAPPASPLTPVLTATNLVTNQDGASTSTTAATAIPQEVPGLASTKTQQDAGRFVPPAQFIDRPPPLPFSGEDSTDAIALRAAISSLQFQRAKAQKDLRTLEIIKTQAVERPEEFRQHIVANASKSAAGNAAGAKYVPPPDSEGDSDSEEDAVASGERDELSTMTRQDARFDNGREIPDSQQTPFDLSFGSVLGSQPKAIPRPTQHVDFSNIPSPQDVVRCPPIEWAKYHILGEPLDKLHKEQRMRPGVGGHQGRESVIAAAYSPFADKLDGDRTSTKDQQKAQQPPLMGGERKDSGASGAESSGQRRRSSKADGFTA